MFYVERNMEKDATQKVKERVKYTARRRDTIKGYYYLYFTLYFDMSLNLCQCYLYERKGGMHYGFEIGIQLCQGKHRQQL